MPHISRDKFEGCVLGLALGDAMGAPYEGGLPERLLWRLIGHTRSGRMRWTDDTQMTLDVIAALLETGYIETDGLAIRFARGYRWSRGYGPGASKVLRRIARGEHWSIANTSAYRQGSFGNGAAMRAPVIGLFYTNGDDQMDDAVRRSAVVTHTHPLGIEGAIVVARATAGAALGLSTPVILNSVLGCCQSDAMVCRFRHAFDWLTNGYDAPVDEVRRVLGCGVAAIESCATAIYLAMRFREASFSDMIGFTLTIGGDADTIAAMAGAIWGAANGAAKLPRHSIDRLEGSERLTRLAGLLSEHDRCQISQDPEGGKLNA